MVGMSNDQTTPDPWQPTPEQPMPPAPTAPAAAVAPTAPAATPPPAAPAGSSQNRWVWAAGTVAASLLAGMVGGGLVALVAGHDDDVRSVAGIGRLDDRGGPGDGDRGRGNGGH